MWNFMFSGFKSILHNKTKLSNFMLPYKMVSLSEFKREMHDTLGRGRIV